MIHLNINSICIGSMLLLATGCSTMQAGKQPQFRAQSPSHGPNGGIVQAYGEDLDRDYEIQQTAARHLHDKGIRPVHDFVHTHPGHNTTRHAEPTIYPQPMNYQQACPPNGYGNCPPYGGSGYGPGHMGGPGCFQGVHHNHSYQVRRPDNLSYPPAGMPGGVIVYPYYTHKGPDDFFLGMQEQ